MAWPASSDGGPPTVLAAFTTPNRNTAPMLSPIMRRHKTLNKLKPLVSARGAHTQSLQVGPSTSSLSPGAPEARLARGRLAWRAGGSPWSALPFKTTNYRSLPNQGQSISTHKSTSSHLWSATRVKQCRILPNATRPQQYCKTCECPTYTRQ